MTSPTGTRRYVCENCGQQERLPLAGCGCQVTCGDCGGPSYLDPFPDGEAIARLTALNAHLEAEDGPLDGRELEV